MPNATVRVVAGRRFSVTDGEGRYRRDLASARQASPNENLEAPLPREWAGQPAGHGCASGMFNTDWEPCKRKVFQQTRGLRFKEIGPS